MCAVSFVNKDLGVVSATVHELFSICIVSKNSNYTDNIKDTRDTLASVSAWWLNITQSKGK